MRCACDSLVRSAMDANSNLPKCTCRGLKQRTESRFYLLRPARVINAPTLSSSQTILPSVTGPVGAPGDLGF
ncbi:hypothetical protein IF2G_01991 [Cordyceps javanica]|nr:hypothetical protein IF2G_01991 [Cordyceps javanica]